MSRSLHPLGAALAVAIAALPFAGQAQQPVNGSHPFATGAACDPELGRVSMRLDVLGSFGSSTANGEDAFFDPGNDNPDEGASGTVYESQPFLCRTVGGQSSGRWLEVGESGNFNANAQGSPNRMVSAYTVDGVRVDMVADLECTTLTQCFTFTNNTAQRLDELALIHYVDGDLFFEGSFNNDFAATSAGIPRVIYEFDAGDDPDQPTTQLALYGDDPGDAFLTGWETGEYSESRRRISTTANGCEPLRNGITDDTGADVDRDDDLVTDNGFDVTLSLRFDAGPLAPGEMSPPICFNMRWGYALACSDEDEDGICVPEDNCPAVPNPDQRDSDGDGNGDACDLCPGDDGDQGDRDRDGRGDNCDNCPDEPNPDQTDANGNGVGDACEQCIDDELCNGRDDDCDGRTDEGNPGAGDRCNSPQQGICRVGTTACVRGAIECRPNAQPGNEMCNALDDDCDGRTDEGNPGGGGRCDTGRDGVCADGTSTCRGGMLACDADVAAGLERCNGQDDDCDGATDEGNPGGGLQCETGAAGNCARGRTACRGGQTACDPLAMPADETCDGEDDDCDGMIDEGDPGGGMACRTGQPGICADGTGVCRDGAIACDPIGVPGEEVCDAVDNDCDGRIDEGTQGGDPCETGQPGVCASGVTACMGADLICVPDVQPAPEACDGLDNDCDGTTDEQVEGIGQRCATGQPGACAAGRRTCVAGSLGCQPDIEPGDEVCNGRDDNCNGTIDEGTRNACGQCGPEPEEACNGGDDDCDGTVDEEAPCPDGQCINGRCVEPCQNNECAGSGLICVDGLCVDPCDLLDCAPGEFCDGQKCVDPCEDVVCGDGELCIDGQCLADDCVNTGCPEGQRCVDFACEPDPCARISCDAGQFCRDGDCVGSCAAVSCPLGERCLDGRCIADDCADVDCPDGQTCAAGSCVEDPCLGAECPPGQYCEGGFCTGDPCATVDCPPGQLCVVVNATAQCVWEGGDDTPPPARDDGVDPGEGDADAGVGIGAEPTLEPEPQIPTNPDGGTDQDEPQPVGCACDADGGAPGPLTVLGLLLLAGLRRRR